MHSLLFVLFLTLLAGCATPSIPLKPVSYSHPVSVKSTLTAIVELHTGIVKGYSGGTTIVPIGNNVFIPVSSGPTPHLQFNEEDQKIFVNSLKKELSRLQLFRIGENIPISDKGPDVKILILFAQTQHNPNYQEYTLDVAMQIEGKGRIFSNKYRVISSEGDTYWTKINTNASQGKKKAAIKLINKLIPDIEQWVKENS